MARPDDPDVCLLRVLRLRAGNDPVTTGELIACATLAGPVVLEERIAGLRLIGYRIEGSISTHWKLVSAPASLIADDVLATLTVKPPPVIGREVVVFEETNSTNDLVARAGDDGQAEGLVIFAEKQRAGRGRLGRVWESRPHQGLWFSVLLRPTAVPVERWAELTFCAALAVAETAERHTGNPARIKWPNDVMVDGRKVAGILLESHQRHRPGFVVMGIGVNVLQDAGDFDPHLRQSAGSFSMVAGGDKTLIERRTVAASLLRNLEKYYTGWPANSSSVTQACRERGCRPPAGE